MNSSLCIIVVLFLSLVAAQFEYQTPLPIPPVLRPTVSTATTDSYDLYVRQFSRQLVPNISETPLWGYNSMWPGPTIYAQQGRAITVRVHNELTDPDANVNVHLHGGRVKPEFDGYPLQMIAPNENFTYYYPNVQPASTLWYHDHIMNNTLRNVNMGLAAFYTISDPEEQQVAALFGGRERDIPLMLQDRSFHANGSIVATAPFLMGTHMFVNGALSPYFEVNRCRYRFRIVNGAQDRVFTLRLEHSNGTNLTNAMHQIATDQGLLESPLPVNSTTLGVAERVEMVIDFSQWRTGTVLRLKNIDPRLPNVLEFRVRGVARCVGSGLPARLSTIERLDPTRANVTRTHQIILNEKVATANPSFLLIRSIPPRSRSFLQRSSV